MVCVIVSCRKLRTCRRVQKVVDLFVVDLQERAVHVEHPLLALLLYLAEQCMHGARNQTEIAIVTQVCCYAIIIVATAIVVVVDIGSSPAAVILVVAAAIIIIISINSAGAFAVRRQLSLLLLKLLVLRKGVVGVVGEVAAVVVVGLGPRHVLDVAEVLVFDAFVAGPRVAIIII